MKKEQLGYIRDFVAGLMKVVVSEINNDKIQKENELLSIITTINASFALLFESRDEYWDLLKKSVEVSQHNEDHPDDISVRLVPVITSNDEKDLEEFMKSSKFFEKVSDE